jgi:hypothetical protein
LVLIGGAYTSAATAREFGGNKFPLLVKAGHSVTVRIARPARRTAGLAYGLLPQGELTLRDTHASVTFVACRRGEPSGNHADGVPITFWSGFVLTRRPACVPLEVHVDDEASPRRVGLALGRSCQIGLAEPPRPVLDFCRSTDKPVPRMCPSLSPRLPGGEPPRDPHDLSGRDFTPAEYAGYLVNFNDARARTGDVGHIILAAQPDPFSLAGEAGTRWPQAGEHPDAEMRIAAGGTLLREESVHRLPAIVVGARPYPAGGIHGGHILVLWNEMGHGYLVSLHYAGGRASYTRRQRIAAALAIAESSRAARTGPRRLLRGSSVP